MRFRYAASSFLALNHSIVETAAILRGAGCEGVEWRLHETGHIRPDTLEADLAEAKKAQAAQDLTPVCLTSYLPMLDPELARRDVDAAAELGAKRVRLLWPPYDGTVPAGEVFSAARQAMDRLVPSLERAGVTMVFETHRGSIVPTASAAKRLVEPYPPALFAVLYDPPNTVSSGFEDVGYALDVLGPHLAHIQVKNVGWAFEDGQWKWGWMGLREGMVDWRVLLRHLERIGFDDWLSNENFLLIGPDERPGRGEVSEALGAGYDDAWRDLAVSLRADVDYLEGLVS
ncbi:MAG: sugar phosphate isomerase/epimerase family protein [Chloroflexota bacterium]